MNLLQGELLRKAKDIGRTKDGNDDVIGSYNPNPFLNALTYVVEFQDSEIKQHQANVIAQKMCSQVDEDGLNIQTLDSIVDYRNDNNVFDKTDAHLRTKSGQQCLRQKISGQSLLTLCNNGEEEVMHLNRLKQALTLETAVFAISRRIDDKSDLKWQVPFILVVEITQ